MMEQPTEIHVTNTTPTLPASTILVRKAQAAGLHLLASFIVLSLLTAWVAWQWFPNGLFLADGGLSGLKLILLIDLVLGATLLFIVFNPRKSVKELWLDVGLIVSLQLAALAFGVYTVYTQRPVALIFTADSFQSLTAQEAKKIHRTTQQLKQIDAHNALPIIYSRAPNTTQEMLEEAVTAMGLSENGILSHMHPERYSAWSAHQSTLKTPAPNALKQQYPHLQFVKFNGRDTTLWLGFNAQGQWQKSVKDTLNSAPTPSKQSSKSPAQHTHQST